MAHDKYLTEEHADGVINSWKDVGLCVTLEHFTTQETKYYLNTNTDLLAENQNGAQLTLLKLHHKSNGISVQPKTTLLLANLPQMEMLSLHMRSRCLGA